MTTYYLVEDDEDKSEPFWLAELIDGEKVRLLVTWGGTYQDNGPEFSVDTILQSVGATSNFTLTVIDEHHERYEEICVLLAKAALLGSLTP